MKLVLIHHFVDNLHSNTMFPSKTQNFSKKFIDVVKILIRQSQIFGLVTFKITEKNIQVSKIHTTYSVTAIFVYISLVCFSIYKTAIESNDRLVIYRTTDILDLITNGCYVCTIWICAVINRDKFMSFLQKMIDFDVKLQSGKTIIKYEKDKRRILLEMLIRYVILATLISILVTCVLMDDKHHETSGIVLGYFLMVINSVACHQMSQFVVMIKARFAILNQQINNIVDYFVKSSVNTIEKKNKNQFLALNKICTLHHHLTKLVKLFNNIFGVVLLLMFGVSFVTIVVSFFYCAGELQGASIRWVRLTYELVSCVSFILDTIYVCDVCYETIEEAKKAGELIHKIETEDNDIRDEIEMFSLQIANEQVEFNAAGFFPVNFTLLFSIIGGVTTYIIILIQLSATLSENT